MGVRSGKLKKNTNKYWLWKLNFGADATRISRREAYRNEILREKWI
jgi:hypothetical protein